MSETTRIDNLLGISKPDFLGEGTWNLHELTPITIILGKNGSGKSLLLRAIREQNKGSCHYCAPERAGTTDYNIRLSQDEGNAEQRAAVSTGNFVRDYRERVVSRIGSFISKIGYANESINPPPLLGQTSKN